MVAQLVKESTCNAGDTSLIPGSGRSPGEGNGNGLQYSCLENPTDRGAWRATVYEVTKSWTWPKRLSMRAGYRQFQLWLSHVALTTFHPGWGHISALSGLLSRLLIYSEGELVDVKRMPGKEAKLPNMCAGVLEITTDSCCQGFFPQPAHSPASHLAELPAQSASPPWHSRPHLRSLHPTS